MIISITDDDDNDYMVRVMITLTMGTSRHLPPSTAKLNVQAPLFILWQKIFLYYVCTSPGKNSFRTSSPGRYYLLSAISMERVKSCFHEAMHDCLNFNHHSASWAAENCWATQIALLVHFPVSVFVYTQIHKYICIARIAIITQAAGPLKLHLWCIFQFPCGAEDTVDVPSRKLFAYCKCFSISVHCNAYIYSTPLSQVKAEEGTQKQIRIFTKLASNEYNVKLELSLLAELF